GLVRNLGSAFPSGRRAAGWEASTPNGARRLPSARWLVTATTPCAVWPRSPMSCRAASTTPRPRSRSPVSSMMRALGVRGEVGGRPPAGAPALVPVRHPPGSIVEGGVEGPAIGVGDERGEDGQRLVAFSGPEEPDQVLTKGRASRPSVEQVVKLGT